MKFISSLFKSCRRYDDLSKRAYDEIYRIEKQMITLFEFQFGLDEDDSDFCAAERDIHELVWQRDYVIFLFRSFDGSIFDDLSNHVNLDDLSKFERKFSILDHHDI